MNALSTRVCSTDVTVHPPAALREKLNGVRVTGVGGG